MCLLSHDNLKTYEEKNTKLFNCDKLITFISTLMYIWILKIIDENSFDNNYLLFFIMYMISLKWTEMEKLLSRVNLHNLTHD